MGADRWGPPSIKKFPFFGVKIPIFRVFFGSNFAECRALGKGFAECRFLALGKEIFADKIFAERPLPSAALGKAFAECLTGFAECPRHSAKRASAVVTIALGKACSHIVSR